MPFWKDHLLLWLLFQTAQAVVSMLHIVWLRAEVKTLILEVLKGNLEGFTSFSHHSFGTGGDGSLRYQPKWHLNCVKFRLECYMQKKRVAYKILHPFRY